MRTVSATEAARHFAGVLDAVEGRRETFVVFRKGRPVARIGPAAPTQGRAVKELMRRFVPDARWADDLKELRAGLAAQERHWNA